jgi:hypothetical protein
MTKLDFLTALCQVREDLETVRLDTYHGGVEASRADARLLILGQRLDRLLDAVPDLEDTP